MTKLSGLTKSKVIFHFKFENEKYILIDSIIYYSKRFKKIMTVESGFISDGATGAEDLVSESWWVHDKACKNRKWDDGSLCDARQSAWIIHDILLEEGRWFRARSWGFFTYLYQRCKELFNKKSSINPLGTNGIIKPC